MEKMQTWYAKETGNKLIKFCQEYRIFIAPSNNLKMTLYMDFTSWRTVVTLTLICKHKWVWGKDLLYIAPQFLDIFLQNYSLKYKY